MNCYKVYLSYNDGSHTKEKNQQRKNGLSLDFFEYNIPGLKFLMDYNFESSYYKNLEDKISFDLNFQRKLLKVISSEEYIEEKNVFNILLKDTQKNRNGLFPCNEL